MIRLRTTALVLSLVVGPTAAQVAGWGRDYPSAVDEARREGKPLFVLVAWKSGCVGCEMLKSGLDSEGPHRALLERFVTVWVVPKADEGTIGAGLGEFAFDHSATPFTAILDPRGRRLDETAGAMSRDGRTANMETYRRKLQGALDRLAADASALDALEAALDRDDPAAVRAFCARCREAGDAARARPHLERLVEIDPTIDEVLALGRLRLAEGRIDEAEAIFAQLEALDRRDESGARARSRLDVMAAHLAAGDSRTAARLGQAYLRAHRDGEGADEARYHIVRHEIETYREAARRNPRTAGRSLARARAAIEEFLRRDPDSPRAPELEKTLEDLPDPTRR